jgi:diguanylate cyclase (GGDEF)-like protein
MYNSTTLERFFPVASIDKHSLVHLYAALSRSMPAIMFFGTVLSIYLYPSLSYKIVVWDIILVILALLRLGVAYLYKRHNEFFAPNQWYSIFKILALCMASMLPLLVWFGFPLLDSVQQIVIIASIMGLTSGASHSLAHDPRLSMQYFSVIFIPLVLYLAIHYSHANMVSSFLLLLYCLLQLSVITDLDKRLKIINKQTHRINSLTQKETIFLNLFKESDMVIFLYDKDLNIIEFNNNLMHFLDISNVNLDVVNLEKLLNIEIINQLKKAFTLGPQTYVGPYTTYKEDILWIEAKFFPYSDNRENLAIGIIEDKTQEKNIRINIEFDANHDPLTGLLNRRGFSNTLRDFISSSKHTEYYSLLFYMDLNGFKSINDYLGHSAGDSVLTILSQRLISALKEPTKIGRFGGDEFLILIPYVSKEKDIAASISSQYENILLEIFKKPFIIGQEYLRVKSSIGAITISPNTNNTDELIRKADIAMYRAKHSPKDIAYYNEAFDTKRKEEFSLQNDLIEAIENNQFIMHFQPIVNMKTNTVTAAEALIRWNHPKLGLLDSREFIFLANKSGLLDKLTWIGLDYICMQISKWIISYEYAIDYVSININAMQLIEDDFVFLFLNTLKKYSLATNNIIIEITEESLIENYTDTKNVIDTLKEHGIHCAIDNFGIGYSSLSYLKNISFHTLKIHREFLKDLSENKDAIKILKGILNIGKELQYNIVIEGIENEKQLSLISAIDNNHMYQGRLFSKALPAKVFEKYFSTH